MTGPYRQSERIDLYKIRNFTCWKGIAYPCFCTDEELDAKRKSRGRKESTHYDGTCRDLNPEVVLRIEKGENFTIRLRFLRKQLRLTTSLEEVTFPDDMWGLVTLRSNGLPVYTCCVIDDWLMKMTHVIRAEDHLPNTMRQVMIYEFGGRAFPICPRFASCWA